MNTRERMLRRYMGMNEMESKVERYYVAYRDMIKNEETLIHRRLTWLLVIQGFIFASYNSKDILDVIMSNLYVEKYLPLMAYTFSLFISSALIASVQAFKRINNEWGKSKPKNYDGPNIFGLPPSFGSGFSAIFPFLSSENCISYSFTIFWFTKIYSDGNNISIAIAIVLLLCVGYFWYKALKK